jgi:excinuclease UvrABC ATPase subunit
MKIRGARQHNLKNLSLDIPRNKLVVITGLSGSGKSSLAFDTIYAEGQRRYVESLSAYARQFLEQMDKPDVDAIEGLSPAISIEQRTASGNPRSTVSTATRSMITCGFSLQDRQAPLPQCGLEIAPDHSKSSIRSSPSRKGPDPDPGPLVEIQERRACQPPETQERQVHPAKIDRRSCSWRKHPS